MCSLMHGLRFTSCKSAKDRTGMSATLEQLSLLELNHNLAPHHMGPALECMRKYDTLSGMEIIFFMFMSFIISYCRALIPVRVLACIIASRTSEKRSTPSTMVRSNISLKPIVPQPAHSMVCKPNSSSHCGLDHIFWRFRILRTCCFRNSPN